jgi:hypothetical protein
VVLDSWNAPKATSRVANHGLRVRNRTESQAAER